MRVYGSRNRLPSIVGVVLKLMETIDLDTADVRALNRRLQMRDGESGETKFQILNPGGRHALAVGLTQPMDVNIEGHAGYYCAGMNQEARITVNGNVGTGVAENMMSGYVRVKGDASQSAGATANGGILVIEGDASARCAISLKGGDVIVCGSVGHMAAFMAQAGRLVVLGNVGADLGDSLYEADIYVRGSVASLGADCEEKEMTPEDVVALEKLFEKAGVDADVAEFRHYGSARRLYNFNIDNASGY
ncbi:MAG: hypothetical protein CFH10_02318 [Alphaproteobacteria bacterium MarineAlpha4_Bin2]|nr:MAG: hypothetical protein CFH10_02318 [Alphaproteobacteria bacterium MarineAlpha4_Bin2]